MVKCFCDFDLTLIFYILKEPIRNIQNFTLIDLVNEFRKMNSKSQYISTRDMSAIDTAGDAASLLIGILLTDLEKKDKRKPESPPVCVHINNNNYNNN